MSIFLIILIVTAMLMIITSLRYAYLKKYSDREFTDILIFVIVGLLFSGLSFIGMINGLEEKQDSEYWILLISFQLPLIISLLIYIIKDVKYKKSLVVNKELFKNDNWK